MHNLPPLSLYIHIPWCIRKCYYCDFNSYSLKYEIPNVQYVKHLLCDLENDLPLISDRKVNTIFIGGGTPSLLSGDAIKMLIDGIYKRLILTKDIEITIETNPHTVEFNRFIDYKKSGINRISIGIQSFNMQKLNSLGRIHNPKEAKYAAFLASSLQLRSFNIDLMYGLPKQSLTEAIDDLYQAIKLNPPHLSWYQLTIEPNTLFSSCPPILPNDNILWNMFQQGHNLLTKFGYKQYETSSYAKIGYFCKHNLNYWRFGDYIGIGCGAHGKITDLNGRIIRTIKTRHPNKFMQGYYLDKYQVVLDDDKPFEYFMNRFRLFEKIPRNEFTNYTGLSEYVIRKSINKAISEGYIKETKKYWKINKKGSLFLNTLLKFFLN